MTLLLRPQGAANIDGALTNCKSALFNLRSSSGYKAAKRDNPNPVSFAHTFSGRAEADILAAIGLLDGTYGAGVYGAEGWGGHP